MLRILNHRFALADLLLAISAIPVCVGAVAAVELTANKLSFGWFGIGWYNNVRHSLIHDIGMSENFVCGYISFAMLDVPAWVCYCAISIGLGLLRSKWSLPVGVFFILSIFLWDLFSDYFFGLHGHLNVRLVSLLGVLLSATCFAITRRLRGKRHPTSEERPRRRSIVLTAFVLAGTILWSAYGWWLIGSYRQDSIEFQEGFEKGLQHGVAQHNVAAGSAARFAFGISLQAAAQ